METGRDGETATKRTILPGVNVTRRDPVCTPWAKRVDTRNVSPADTACVNAVVDAQVVAAQSARLTVSASANKGHAELFAHAQEAAFVSGMMTAPTYR